MGLLDFLFGSTDTKKPQKKDWDTSVFDNDRYKSKGSGNWVDWEDVSTGESKTDGFKHPYHDQDGEW